MSSKGRAFVLLDGQYVRRDKIVRVGRNYSVIPSHPNNHILEYELVGKRPRCMEVSDQEENDILEAIFDSPDKMWCDLEDVKWYREGFAACGTYIPYASIDHAGALLGKTVRIETRNGNSFDVILGDSDKPDVFLRRLGNHGK